MIKIKKNKYKKESKTKGYIPIANKKKQQKKKETSQK